MNSTQHTLSLVLCGYYPAGAVSKMDTPKLQRFVNELVRRTSENCDSRLKKPVWWPRDVAFKILASASSLTGRSTLKEIVFKCSEHFKKGPLKVSCKCHDRFASENNENVCVNNIRTRRTLVTGAGAGTAANTNTTSIKRKTSDYYNNNNNNNGTLKKFKLDDRDSDHCPSPDIGTTTSTNTASLQVLDEIGFDPEPEPEEVIDQNIDEPTKEQFLDYVRLRSKNDAAPTPVPYDLRLRKAPLKVDGSLKLTNCLHIPFSSDIGRKMSANENHNLPEALKLRRLERVEWYLSGECNNKPALEPDYEVTYNKCDEPHHEYSFPKRQLYQCSRPLRFSPFVLRHLRSVHVRVERENLNVLQKRLRVVLCKSSSESQRIACRRLVVLLNKSNVRREINNNNVCASERELSESKVTFEKGEVIKVKL